MKTAVKCVCWNKTCIDDNINEESLHSNFLSTHNYSTSAATKIRDSKKFSFKNNERKKKYYKHKRVFHQISRNNKSRPIVNIVRTSTTPFSSTWRTETQTASYPTTQNPYFSTTAYSSTWNPYGTTSFATPENSRTPI